MKTKLVTRCLVFVVSLISSNVFAENSSSQLNDLLESTKEKMFLASQQFKNNNKEIIDPNSISLDNFPADYKELKFPDDVTTVDLYVRTLALILNNFNDRISMGTKTLLEDEAMIERLTQFAPSRETREARTILKNLVAAKKDSASSWAGMTYEQLLAEYNTNLKRFRSCSLQCRTTLSVINNHFLDFTAQSIYAIDLPENSIMDEKNMIKEVNAYLNVFVDDFIRGISIIPPFLGLPFLSQDIYDGKFFGLQETVSKLRKEDKKSLKSFSRNYESVLLRKALN